MINLISLIVLSSFSIGFFADPLAQGASVKIGTKSGIAYSVVTSGRIGEKRYEYWLYDGGMDSLIDTIGTFHWFKLEVRAERPYFERKGVKLYFHAGLGTTSDREWIFNEGARAWKEYNYKSVGVITGTGLYVYPFPFILGLLETGEKSARRSTRIEDGFMIQIELINLYYRRYFGERPIPDFSRSYDYGGLGMGIGVYYTF